MNKAPSDSWLNDDGSGAPAQEHLFVAAMAEVVPLWLDLRSPYSWVAHVCARRLERDYDIVLDRRPFMLKIAAGGGDPALFQRRIRYLYMDVRRFAAPLGLSIRGPTRIFDPFVAAAAFLHAGHAGVLNAFLDAGYARFFDRALDIEDRDAVSRLLGEVGADSAAFTAYLDGNARAELQTLQTQAEAMGVFGVPTFVLDGELFWGQDRMDLLAERLAAKGLAHAGPTDDAAG